MIECSAEEPLAAVAAPQLVGTIRKQGSTVEQPGIERVISEIDTVHRELAKLSLGKLTGTPSALNTAEILEAHPLPLQSSTLAFVGRLLEKSGDWHEHDKLERVLFACRELVVLEGTASLGDMLNFYMERGRMVIGGEKIPALEVVPWLQAETDFGRREEMKREITIFLKGIVNPMLLGMLELAVRAVTEKLGYENFAAFAEAKKQISFEKRARIYAEYLDRTDDLYNSLMDPWVVDVIGRPRSDLSRYHALHLLRIRDFDEYFPAASLNALIRETFSPLGLDPDTRPDVVVDISSHKTKNPDGICIGVEIPGEIHVLAKPVGGLIDVETVLHEMGHAFFLSHFSADLPLQYRRLYRSAALDETFAFLFMNLIGNVRWLAEVPKMPAGKAEELARRFSTKRLCLIRRYIGKFLAEKELHESRAIKDPGPYCRNLQRATGFVYEPEGYLIDMDPDFYSVDYLSAWAGAHVLGKYLESNFGPDWFASAQAGAFLRGIAASGRKDSPERVLASYCNADALLPDSLGI